MMSELFAIVTRSLVAFVVFFILCLGPLTASVELTFELPDNAKECFYEHLKGGVQTTLEFQVVTGGQYDVDVSIEGPNGQVVYKEIKKQYDSHSWMPNPPGIYSICFSNEFSTFSHKLIYFDLQIGEEPPLPGVGEHITAMTQLESSAQEIHDNLNSVKDYQTHHRLQEAHGRKRAEDLNERVLFWSILVALAILVASIAQVFVLKSFFSEKKPSEMRNPLLSR